MRSEDSQNFSVHPYRAYRAHRAVFFAIAQLSCPGGPAMRVGDDADQVESR